MRAKLTGLAVWTFADSGYGFDVPLVGHTTGARCEGNGPFSNRGSTQISNDDESWHELLNVCMRGGGEIQWRYTRESFAKCLTRAGFKRYEILELDDPRATSFTHSLPGEDMVFLCCNAE
jgi:hypothetical protein